MSIAGVRVWLLILVVACGVAEPQVPLGEWANVAPARVEEVARGEGRTYLRVREAQYEFWVSVPAIEAAPGDHVLLGKGPLIYGQRSADADRLFDALTVIEQVAIVDEATANAAIRLPVAEGGLDIASVYGQRAALAGKPVTVRGRIVKAAKNVQGTNWYHIKDGSSGPAEGEDDLTFTTGEELAVGAVIVARGPLTIDKDLGFGYFYAAIIEGATVVVESEGQG